MKLQIDYRARARSGSRTGRRASVEPPERRRVAPACVRPAVTLLLVAFAVVTLVTGCQRADTQRETTMPQRPIVEVLATHTPELMRVPGVVGTYQGSLADGRPCIKLMVVRVTPELREKLPRTLEGWPVELDETGEIHALGDSAR